MQHSEHIGKLLAALVKAQADIKTIGYDSKNTFFNAKYASLTAIVENIRPILARHGLVVVQGSENTRYDARDVVMSLDVTATLFHESGEWLRVSHTVPVEADPISKGSDIRMPNPQTIGKAVTYGRRYVLSSLLCLVTDEDTDGNHPARDPRQQSQPAPKKADPKPDAKPEPEGNAPIGTEWDGTDEDAFGFVLPVRFKGYEGKPLRDIPHADLAEFVAKAGVKPRYIHIVNRINAILGAK